MQAIRPCYVDLKINPWPQTLALYQIDFPFASDPLSDYDSPATPSSSPPLEIPPATCREMISHLRCRVEASYSEMLHKLQYYLIPILRLPKSLNENISYIVMTVNHMRYPQKTVAVGRGKTWKSLCRDSQNCNASEPGMEKLSTPTTHRLHSFSHRAFTTTAQL